MKEIQKVIVCGIGAIGSIYANKLNEYDSENLRILVDEKRLKKYTFSPHIFNGKEMKLNYITPDKTDFTADLIIIATKFDGLNDVIKNMKNFVGEDTIIISLINGVTSEDIIAKEYGYKHLMHSFYIGHSAMRNGNYITFDGCGTIVFGIKDTQKTDECDLERVKSFFDKVGINYKIPDDISRSMWLKYMLNVSCNQTSAVLKTSFGQMQKNTKYRALIKNIMLEVLSIAEKSGISNTQSMLDEAFAAFDKMSPDGKTSMLQDVEAGRKTELAIFADTVINLGVKYNIPTPYNTILKEMIEVMENQSENI
mgnify:CR=1 FL=1